MSKKSKNPTDKNFDPSELSMVELANADSFTRQARLEQITGKKSQGGYKGNYDMYMASGLDSGVTGQYGTGDRGISGASGARYERAAQRSRAFQWAANADEQKKRQQLTKDSEAMSGKLSSLQTKFNDLEKAQQEMKAQGGPAEKPQGDLVIGSSRPDKDDSNFEGPLPGESSFSKKYLTNGVYNVPNLFGDSDTTTENKTGNTFDESTTADAPKKDPQLFADKYKLDLINTGATKSPNKQKPDLMQ